MVRRGVDWLRSVQNPDGGWGESCHSYVDESFAGVGAMPLMLSTESSG